MHGEARPSSGELVVVEPRRSFAWDSALGRRKVASPVRTCRHSKRAAPAVRGGPAGPTAACRIGPRFVGEEAVLAECERGKSRVVAFPYLIRPLHWTVLDSYLQLGFPWRFGQMGFYHLEFICHCSANVFEVLPVSPEDIEGFSSDAFSFGASPVRSCQRTNPLYLPEPIQLDLLSSNLAGSIQQFLQQG